MSQIQIPNAERVPAASRPLLDAVQQKFGRVPNLIQLLSLAPAGLQGYLSLASALEQGALSAPLREQLAITVAAFNRCEYCLAAHSTIGQRMAGLSLAEVTSAATGESSDPKPAAALRFARRILSERGRVNAEDLARFLEAGHDEAAALEIVAHVALNVLTNYANNLGGTPLDFPAVTLPAA